MSETAEAREKELRSRLDCGDNSCRYATTKGGMRTNGGCRCTRSTVMAQYVPLLETSLAAERQRADDAEALIREMDYCFRIERDGMAESLCSEYVAKHPAAVDERQK
jgi:hypothetical protein